MSLETRSFRFEEFLLDLKGKVLLRDQKPVPITPKAFLLLQILVENHGRIVEKEQLMAAVWADSFVEDGNLSFTVNLLRKALADNKQDPRFIETVPRRGYRFIGKVEQIFNDHISKNEAAGERFRVRPARRFVFSITIAAVLLFGTLVVGTRYARITGSEPEAPILSAPFKSEKLSTDGKVVHAVLSSDGKNVVYTYGIYGKQSVWLRQLESSHNVEIIPPSDDNYGGLALSTDGNFLYFMRRPRNVEGQNDIYRVSIFGGVPTKIVGAADGWISVSPDGEKISFVRCAYTDDEFCSLWMADSADGKNEKRLASRRRPFRIGDNEISPDGRTVAFAAGQSENAANEFSLVEVDIESGVERELTTQKFFNIKSLAWLSNRSGLLITASRIPNNNFRIWQVSATSGDVQPLTKDSETYSALSLNKEASLLVSTQVTQNFHLLLYHMNNPSGGRVIADAIHSAFAPNGKIIFSSTMSGNQEIWSINADGNGQSQLTNDAADDSAPVASPDNNSIFFASNRTGEVHVWRMNADGSNQVQITQKEGGFPLFVSPDGKWLYYHSGRQRTLWRHSTKGEEEQSVLNKGKNWFGFSPDGLQVAFTESQDKEKFIMIVSLADGQKIKSLRLPTVNARIIGLNWLPDGKSFVYVFADSEYKNNTLWLQPLDGGTPQQIAELGDEEVEHFSLSPDGKSFAIARGGWKHDAVLIEGLR